MNGMWLNSFSTGWIEAGMMYDFQLPHYFWAETKPDGVYAKHWISEIPQADIGNYAFVRILYMGDNLFHINIQAIRDGRPVPPPATNFNVTAQNMLWQGRGFGWVSIGQELAGTEGAAARVAFFLYNRWYEQIGGQGGQFETFDSDVKEDAPPYGAWLARPSTTDNGGQFFTQCCLPLNTAGDIAVPADRATTPQLLEVSSVPPIPEMTPVSGVRAIQPTLAGRVPAFREEDVREFVMRNPVSEIVTDASRKSIAHLECGIHPRALAAHLGDLTLALSPDISVCYVGLSGDFTLSVPPENGQSQTPISYERAFEVFDAKTGNILLSGFLP